MAYERTSHTVVLHLPQSSCFKTETTFQTYGTALHSDGVGMHEHIRLFAWDVCSHYTVPSLKERLFREISVTSVPIAVNAYILKPGRCVVGHPEEIFPAFHRSHLDRHPQVAAEHALYDFRHLDIMLCREHRDITD